MQSVRRRNKPTAAISSMNLGLQLLLDQNANNNEQNESDNSSSSPSSVSDIGGKALRLKDHLKKKQKVVKEKEKLDKKM